MSAEIGWLGPGIVTDYVTRWLGLFDSEEGQGDICEYGPTRAAGGYRSAPASPALTSALPSPLRRGDGHERSNECRAERRGRLVVERQCTAQGILAPEHGLVEACRSAVAECEVQHDHRMRRHHLARRDGRGILPE